MTEHVIAVAALAIAVADMILSVVALYFLIGIWRDDRAMRIAAEESLKAQLEYLGLRRRWYDQRSKKNVLAKENNEKANLRPVDGANQDGVQPAGGSD